MLAPIRASAAADRARARIELPRRAHEPFSRIRAARALRGQTLRFAQANQPLAAATGRNAPAQIRGRRTFFGAVFKEADAVELGASDPLFEVLDVLVALARKSDDERRAHRDSGDARSELFDQLEIALAVAGPAHRAQHVGVRVLQRHVHVLTDFRQPRDRIDQLGIYRRRIKVEEPNPFQSVDLV